MNAIRIVSIFLFLFVIFLTPAEAQSQSARADQDRIFFDGNASPPGMRLSNWHERLGAAVMEARPLAVNLRALQTPGPSQIPANKVPAHGILVGHTFDIILPGQAKPITLEVNKVEQIVDGVVTYSGSLAGDAEAFFTFSVEGRKSLGRILIGDVAVIVRPNGDTEGHELIMVDRGLLPIDDDTIPSNPENTSGTADTFSTTGASSTGSGDVRTLFLFANNVGNESLMTSTIISEFNNALSRSGVASSNKLSAAGIITVPDGFTGSFDCKGGILYDMHRRFTPFAAIDQWMDGSAADIAFLVVSADPLDVDCLSTKPWSSLAFQGRIGGVATGFFPGDSGIQDLSTSPFSLSSDTYVLGDLTALHEIGHTLGGRHADRSSSVELDFINGEFAHGFDNDNAGEWQTIMGGYRASTANRCAFDFDNPDPVTQPCERIPYFSNPAKSATINGQFVPTLGATTITGTPGDVNVQFKADMETWLETSGMPIVSGYFQDPPPPTSAPVLDVIPGFCFGFSTVNWTAATDASNYRLFRSFTSGFSSPTLIFDGSGTSTNIDIPGPPEPSTWYLRVKACNSGGCSGWSNQKSANWVDGCF